MEAGAALLGFGHASLYEHVGGDTWRQLAAIGLQGTVTGAAEQVPAFTRLAAELEGPIATPLTGDLLERASVTVPEARFLVATPIRSEGQLRGLLLLSTEDEDPAPSPDAYDVLELLAGHASTAMRNADLLAAESRTVAELRDLDTMKDDFLSILTHELRSPMTAMAGSAELLRDRWSDIAPERRDEFLAAIQRNTNRLSTLIQDVFDALKAERTDLPVNLGPTDLLPLVVEAAEQEVSRSSRHELRFEVDPDAPPVLADADRVSQILHNLLSNAVKYSPAGGTVTVGPRATRLTTVAVWVRDQGLGHPGGGAAPAVQEVPAVAQRGTGDLGHRTRALPRQDPRRRHGRTDRRRQRRGRGLDVHGGVPGRGAGRGHPDRLSCPSRAQPTVRTCSTSPAVTTTGPDAVSTTRAPDGSSPLARPATSPPGVATRTSRPSVPQRVR